MQRVTNVLLVPNPALRFSPPARPAGDQRSFLQRLLPGRRVFRPPSKHDDSGKKGTVWTLRNGGPAAVPVVIGATDGRRTEIAGGSLAVDQTVIVDAVTARR